MDLEAQPAELCCTRCNINVSSSCGLRCKLVAQAGASPHFTCDGCLDNLVQASNAGAGMRRFRGGAPCPGEVGAGGEAMTYSAPAWTMHGLMHHVEHATLFSLVERGRAVLAAAEADKWAMSAAAASATHNSKAAAALATITSAALSALDLDAKLRVCITAIEEQVLRLKCPRCKTPLADYSGCDVMQCPASTCQQHMCALCFHSGSEAEVRAHVTAGHHHGLDDASGPGGAVAFKEAHAVRQCADVAKIVVALPESEAFKARLLLELAELIDPLAGLLPDGTRLIALLVDAFNKQNDAHAQLVISMLVKVHERSHFAVAPVVDVLCSLLLRSLQSEHVKRECTQLLASALQEEPPLDAAIVLRIDSTITSLLGSGQVSPAVAALACKLLRLTAGRLRMAGTALPDLRWNLERYLQ